MAYKRIFFNDPIYTSESLFAGYAYDMMIIIPAYAEEYIELTIDSLVQAKCTKINVGILVCINEGEGSPQKDISVNERTFHKLSTLIDAWNIDGLTLHCIYVKAITDKWAGVGMARRIAIEQASYMLQESSSPIVNLDADCTVSPNYIQTIYDYFQSNKAIELVCIHFEHPLDSNINRDYILQYESHLRYFIGIQKSISLPYAYHTVGSSFAVRAKAYHQVGGMNKRKAGEDFYFIHKFTKKGTIGNLGDCIVYPSSRVSYRVPFGTGRAMLQLEKEKEWLTYHPESFSILKVWLTQLPKLYTSNDTNLDFKNIDVRLNQFLSSVNARQTIIKIKSNVTRYELFLKSFFQWFDGFMLMKYLHFMRDEGLTDIPVLNAIELCTDMIQVKLDTTGLDGYLAQLRILDMRSKYVGHTSMLDEYSTI